MNATAIVLTVVVPLLLTGFLNFFAHKPWILYMPLLGLLIGLGYAGHFLIQSYAYPSKELDKHPPVSLETPTPTATPMSNTNISSTNQSGGFTGINQGIINQGPPKRVLTTEQKATLEKMLVPADKKEEIDLVYSNQDEEQRKYGESWAAILQKAGFNVIVKAGMVMNSPPIQEGIRIISPKEDAANEAVLMKALTEAHVRGEWHKFGIHVRGTAPISITIGPNPEK